MMKTPVQPIKRRSRKTVSAPKAKNARPSWRAEAVNARRTGKSGTSIAKKGKIVCAVILNIKKLIKLTLLLFPACVDILQLPLFQLGANWTAKKTLKTFSNLSHQVKVRILNLRCQKRMKNENKFDSWLRYATSRSIIQSVTSHYLSV